MRIHAGTLGALLREASCCSPNGRDQVFLLGNKKTPCTLTYIAHERYLFDANLSKSGLMNNSSEQTSSVCLV